MAYYNLNTASDEMLLRAPRLPKLELPDVESPFAIRESLAIPLSGVFGRHGIDFGVPDVRQALRSLTPFEAGQAATSPPTRVVRIVHDRLDRPIYIPRRAGFDFVTVYDILEGIHSVLWSEFTLLNTLDAFQQQEVILAAQERCRRTRWQSDSVRHIDILDGATLFIDLVQDVPRARRYIAHGVNGIDGYQALTWILQTQEPHMGLGRYPRLQ